MKLILPALLLSCSLFAASDEFASKNELTLSGGGSITPYRNSMTTYGPASNDMGQSSRPGPTATLQYTRWLTPNNGLFIEGNYQNSSMELHPTLMAWTLHRISGDFGYERKFPLNPRFVPFVKLGVGPMVFVSAEASQDGGSAGLNWRPEAMASLGIQTKLSRHLNMNVEYEARLLRGNDTSDPDWNARNVIISEPKIGIGLHW